MREVLLLFTQAKHCRRVLDPDDMYGKLYRGEFQLVFVSPEMILCDERWNDISSSEYHEHLVGLVVDEAHCVKT